VSRYLLDTHVLIWMRENDLRLNRRKWEPVFYDKRHTILFSTVSLWEIAIKRGLGKLKLDGDLADFPQTLEVNHGFQRLGIDIPELCRLEKLPQHHADPFDRLLIVQSIEHSAIAVTNDTKWQPYPVLTDF
jgi:PIN domain nuclease of toxin-antitoxin system